MIITSPVTRTTEERIKLLHHNRDMKELILLWASTNNIPNLLPICVSRIQTILDEIEEEIRDDYPPSKVHYSDSEIANAESEGVNILYDPSVLHNLVDWERGAEEFISSDSEALQFLLDRGVTRDSILKYTILHSSQLTERQRVLAGATIHPDISLPLEEEPECIVFPVRDRDSRVLGCHCRYLNTLPYIKFTSSIPNFYLYSNLHTLDHQPEEVWIVEGVFDALALGDVSNDIYWLSPSSGYFSECHYFNASKYLKDIKKINVLLDSDAVGTRSAVVLKEYYGNQREVNIYSIPEGKDPAEFFIKHDGFIGDLKLMSDDDLKQQYSESKRTKEISNFSDYLSNREIQGEQSNYSYMK
jgi:hypothetical protein